MHETKQRAALVTGAGSGVGLACARALAAGGFAVALVGRRATPLDAAAAAIGAAGGSALSIVCDVADAGAMRRAVAECAERLGGLDALVNNAGVAELAPIERHTPEMIGRVFATNALGPANAIAAAWPIMAAQRSGVIVNVSSMATRDPFAGFFAYAASKASVNLMARSCAKEGAALGIRAFSVAPGAVETAMLRSMFNERAVAPERCLSPAAVAAVIVACVRGERDAENGETIYLSA